MTEASIAPPPNRDDDVAKAIAKFNEKARKKGKLCEPHLKEGEFQVAGRNVLLAYLLSEMLPGLLDALRLGDFYGHLAANLPCAIARSALCAVLILLASTGLNRLGFALKL